jgi:hypothetical protein
MSSKRAPIVIALGLLVAGVFAVVYQAGSGSRSSSEESDGSADAGGAVENPLERAEAFYETRPYYQQPHPHSEVPEGLSNLRAETCGQCHQAIYEEWKVSTHRRAWTDDAQFMKELAKSRGAHSDKEDPDDVGWMCVTCHTPMVNQLERLVVGLEDGDIGQPIYADNPSYDPKLQDEAITCATCHVRDGTVYGPYGDTDAPHPTAKDESLRTVEVCADCHQAEAHWPERTLACFFSTVEEWRQSSYADNDQTCQSCHMPKVERKLAAAYDRPKRKTRRHWFGGSLIPKKPEFADEIEPLEKVYGSGADIAVEAGKPAETPGADGRLNDGRCPEGKTCRHLTIRVTNAHAGHYLPTGDPERHIDVEAVARTDGGDRLAVAEQRFGSKYKWWPEITKQYDTRLAPGASRTFELAVPVGDEAFEVEVVAHKYRMYPEAFRHHDLEGEYVRGRRFHRSTWRVGPDGAVERTRLENDTSTE